LQAYNHYQCGRSDRPSRVGAYKTGANGQDKGKHKDGRQDQHFETACKYDPDQQAYECGEEHFTITSPGCSFRPNSLTLGLLLQRSMSRTVFPNTTNAELDPLFPDHNLKRLVT
jgi:hypothetical protein